MPSTPLPLITVLLTGVNLLVFALNRLVLPSPIVSTPGRLDWRAFMANFSHMGVGHLAMNLFVLWQVLPVLERSLPPQQIVGMLLSIWLTVVGLGWQFAKSPALGFSGIGLGIITFMALFAWHIPSLRNQLLFWLAVNIAIGFQPGISLEYHVFGAIGGVVAYGLWRVF
ncbi:rhomboid family intramembrane serine protease [Candidatus Peribacteria bacterium]|nr:rhomboid family intramembrane serine protease [Candidatus Peribacteria bacterium]